MVSTRSRGYGSSDVDEGGEGARLEPANVEPTAVGGPLSLAWSCSVATELVISFDLKEGEEGRFATASVVRARLEGDNGENDDERESGERNEGDEDRKDAERGK